MKTKTTFISIVTVATVILSATYAPAQEEVYRPIVKEGDVVGFTKPMPITVSGFSGEVEQVLRFDLEVQGFKLVSDGTPQYEVTGSNAGSVQGRLSDRISKTPIFSKAYTGGSLRTQAHALADDVVAALTKRKGIGQTKIAFKVDTGAASEVYIADFDGHNAHQVTRDNTIVAAPVWVPGQVPATGLAQGRRHMR